MEQHLQVKDHYHKKKTITIDKLPQITKKKKKGGVYPLENKFWITLWIGNAQIPVGNEDKCQNVYINTHIVTNF